MLERWRQESPRHEEEYREARAYILSREERAGKEMVRGEWQRFERKHYGRRVVWRTVARYAAMLVLPLCAAGWLWFSGDGEGRLSRTDDTEIVPGGGKAVLILANGQSVELRDEKGLQVDTGGSVVSAAGEKVVYRQQADSSTVEKYNTLVVPRGGNSSWNCRTVRGCG